MSDWYLNGEPSGDVPINSRGLHYGDGIFETVAVRDGGPRLWSLHMDRLSRGCERLELDVPDADELLERIEGSGTVFGVAKIVVSAKGAERGYARPTGQTDVMVGIFDAAPMPDSIYERGIDLMICDTRLATGSAIAGLKTLNRLEQVLASNEVILSGFSEGLTRDADGRLICGTMSNLFAVKDDTIITPDLSRCGVEGVMRRHIIETLTADHRSIEVTDISSLDDVQEVFLSNSLFGVLPVRSCGDNHWGIGPVTRDVVKRLAQKGVEEWSQ